MKLPLVIGKVVGVAGHYNLYDIVEVSAGIIWSHNSSSH